MKRFISILLTVCLCTTAIFAYEYDDDDDYDDGYVYEQNGAGDQFLKIDIMGTFPLNFDGQLHTGGGLALGYYRFLSSNFGLGGSAIIGYNVTIGKKSLVTFPVTFGALYQPYAGKFEFPMTLEIGFATSSCQGLTYFPGFAAKATGGVYYRFTEAWSAGLSGSAFWLPQWKKDSDLTRHGLFATGGLCARYHF